jgi:hypothetical protein
VEGIVQKEDTASIAKKMAMTTKDALHEEYLVAMPDDTLPRMNPIGFPQPRAPVAILRLRPSG